jgi:hypothetical protein
VNLITFLLFLLLKVGSVEVPNSQCISCLDSSLGRVPGAGDPGSIPGGDKVEFPAQATQVRFLADSNFMFVSQSPKDDPGQVSL